MNRKIRVAVVFGGKSAEHEVSLQSAKSVIDAIDKEKYEVVPIGIDKQGQWRLGADSQYLLHENNPKLIALNEAGDPVALVPMPSQARLMTLGRHETPVPIDVVFPLLHGSYGEDGSMQGLLKLADMPYVGAGVLGSAIGMDKDVMKRLLRDAGLPVARFMAFRRHTQPSVQDVVAEIGLPCFVKPANLGSSVGVSKVEHVDELPAAIDEAFQYDNKVLIEECINGREIECSVLGNDDPIASVPGEIIPNASFYSYEAKYIDENGAQLIIPADLAPNIQKIVQELSISAFTTLECEGMARVDMFLRDGKEVILNEINTIPGFTRISMYPKLWEASGIGFAKLIDRLIQLAMARHTRDAAIKTSCDL